MMNRREERYRLGRIDTQEQIDNQWVGHINEIHEGGQPFGAKMVIIHVSRNDVDFSEDVPIMGEETDKNTDSSF